MAVALEQEAALAGPAGGEEPGDRPVVGPEHTMLEVDREATLAVHEHGFDGPERIPWRLVESAARRLVAPCRPGWRGHPRAGGG